MLSQSVTGTILVADDQAANRELLEELLTTQGFKVITVSDGADALDELRRTQVDVVLLDVMMPHLSGFEVCERIKSDPSTYLIPVIVVTALSGREDRIEGIKAGADDFLARPVDRMELLARVRSLLKLKYRTDELERAETVLFSLARSIEGKDPYTHGHCERLAVLRIAGYTSWTAGGTNHRTATCRCGPRHRKNCRTGLNPLEARQSERRGVETHSRASRRGRTNLFSVEVIPTGTSDHSPPPRKA